MTGIPLGVGKGGNAAIISDCGLYRYRLDRSVYGEGSTAIIMVNPSTADATEDDHTIRKLKGFGAIHGWGQIVVGNLFAYRATDVRELAKAADPIGTLNDEHLLSMIHDADRVIVAWGPVTKVPKALRRRWFVVWSMLDHLDKQAFSIGPTAKCGHPKHPLTLAYSLPILPWSKP